MLERLLIAVFTVALAGPAAAISLADIQDETYWTIFGDTGSVVVAGQPYAPTPAQNPLGAFSTFEDPGRVSFVNQAPYYLFGASAWAFAGPGTARVVFSQPIASVSIAARGTAEGDVTGALSRSPFGPSTLLAGAMLQVVALDAGGAAIAGSETAITNLSLLDPALPEIAYTAAGLGQPIYGLAFTQEANAENVGFFLGGLGVTPVPEPGTAALLGVAAVALWARRR